MKNQYDIAIVGGGLAGCSLAVELKKKNFSFCLFNASTLSASSRVAAGIINPIVFKRTTLSWKAQETISYAISFYQQTERDTNTVLLHLNPITRVFSGFEEQNEWLRKSCNDAYKPFLQDEILNESSFNGVTAPYGLSGIHHSGWLDTKLFIDTIFESVIGQENIQSEPFIYSDLQTTTNGFLYNGVHFQQIVFCEGHLVQNNPFFNAIQLYPVKGEVISIENTMNCASILSGGVYFVPQPNDQIKIGATYDWKNLNEDVTHDGRNELIKKLSAFYKGPIQITMQEAGIRPASKDRKPIIGEHPRQKNMFVLNGLGTKGVSLAPWCAQQLVQLITHKINLDPSVDVKRFFT